jgi:uncharacterized membrane protein YgcG
VKKAWPALSGILFGLATAASSGAQEREEILTYDVTVEVQADGWMEITEEIRVRALGQEIQRGIYRDFPTRFPRTSGFGRVTAPFEVVEVRRDGRPEPYALQSVGGPAGRGGVRVRIGDANVFLPSGEHTYTLTYLTNRWMIFGEDADQLYWNVTGHGWAFPILSASARVILPGRPSPDEVSLEGWTGPEGSTAADLTSRSDSSGTGLTVAVFRTTAPLGREEGMTVRVTFPKGVVQPPTEEQEAEWFRVDWGSYLDAGILAGLVLAVYLLMWLRVGRDPVGRPTLVQYDPPEGFSAAALGYLEERGYDGSQFTAALVDLGVKGALRIERDGRKWRLESTGRIPPTVGEDERKVLSLLMGSKSSITLTSTSNPRVRKAAKALRRKLKRQLEKHYFVTNRGWFFAGLAITLAGFAALTWRTRFSIAPQGWFFGIWLTGWSIAVGSLLVRVYHEWAQAVSGDVLGWFSAIFTTLFSIPFVAAEVFVLYMAYDAVPLHLAAAAAVLGLINALFYHLLERPTLKGRGVLDRLEGFREFLTATEADRFDRLQRPERSMELFERYLPHAIALGVESRWAKAFEGVLDAPAASRGGPGAGPSWYDGSSGSSHHSFADMASSLGGALSSSLSASSATPSSSGGGGGGGGSSGGGGGGGGGGGW